MNLLDDKINYVVFPDGSIRRKIPKIRMSKKARRKFNRERRQEASQTT